MYKAEIKKPNFSLGLIYAWISSFGFAASCRCDRRLECHRWNSFRYQRDSSSHHWEAVGSPIPVALGRNGMAWGIDQSGPMKKEGDGRSPAGFFFLGPAFGDAEHLPYAKKIPFLLITEDLECVDDPDSVYYNQFVYANTIEKLDWKSSEKMKEIGPLYALGLVVQYNRDPVIPGRGSAIFMHIWRNKGSGSGGCTTMQENDLQDVISWLDSEQHPCLVQMPLQEYENLKLQWGLPEVEDKVKL